MNLKSRLIGLLVALLGIALSSWDWYGALKTGTFYIKIALIAPMLVVAGIGKMIFPDVMVKKKAGEMRDRKDNVIYIIISGLSLLAGLLNFYFIRQ